MLAVRVAGFTGHEGMDTPTALQVARCFLRLAADEPEPEPMTHMRLQKLLYYAQGLALAYRDRPLFGERMEAWIHGPVVPAVYPAFADYGDEPIPRHEVQPVELDSATEEFVTSVWEGYRRYSASELRRMTHREQPWKEARRGLPDDSASKSEITIQSMRAFFSKLCDEEMRRQSGVSMEDLRRSETDARNGRTSSWAVVKKRLGIGVSD